MKSKIMIYLLIAVIIFTGCSTVSDSIEESSGDVSSDIISNEALPPELEADTQTDLGMPPNMEHDRPLDGQTRPDNMDPANMTPAEVSVLDVSDMFTERDLENDVDVSDAQTIALEDNDVYEINDAGTYIFTGDVTNAMILVDIEDEKAQIILDDLTIINDDQPAIYVKSADKVFITSMNDTYLEVTGDFEADGDTNLDAVIFSKEDLVLNGTGSVTIVSNQGNGVTSKDDLKVTGASWNIVSKADSLEANDSIRIYDGNISIVTDKDGLHSENEDDLSLGYIYIYGGRLDIQAGDDAIRGTSIVRIDGGTINIQEAVEGIEATQVQINGGIIDIYALDDGVNATRKSNLDVVIEVNGGDITVDMASGDTDGFDSNGDLYVNDGRIVFTGGSSFDADGIAELNGGSVTVNGSLISEFTQERMPGRKR